VPEFDARIFHHDLCFGCGQANLFGLQLELEPRAEGGVEGRFFVKQDHQGPPGFVHRGVLAAALDEAMALLLHGRGTFGRNGRLEVEYLAPAPVGAFVTVRARALEHREPELVLEADAATGNKQLARARGTFILTAS
jgi:acyl-coenzyme A thioesterase PaaI-like protein